MTTSTLPPRSPGIAGGSVPTCPYIGLVPFSEKDTAYFFGRDRESEVIVANLTAARLTLLYAPSGVGKSSVLRAGVIPRLRALAAEDDDEELGIARSAVAYVSEWSSTPLEAAAAKIGQALAASGTVPAPDTAPPPRLGLDWLRNAMEDAGVAVLYLILDQFEEYLFYYPADTDSDELTKALSEILTARDLDVQILVSVREDALAGLDRFKGHVPHLFGNYLRLAHLTREAARRAIEGPVETYNGYIAPGEAVTVEPALVEELLDQVRTGNVVVGRDSGASNTVPFDGRGDIETPYLQLVLTRLWDQERSHGSASLRRQTLDELGGAQTIVQSHLDTVISGLTPEQVQVAAGVFHHLVTASGSKIALAAADLAEWSGQPVNRVQDLLEVLSSGDKRILRPVPPAVNVTGPPRYEIFHDVMGAAVLDWRRRYVAQRQQEMASRRLVAEREQAEEAARIAKRQLRLTLVSVVLVVVLLVAAGLGVMTYRSIRSSEQQQLLREAAVALAQNPGLSLQKAVEAFRQGDNVSSRSAVLQAASSLRGRLVAGPGEQTHDMVVAGMDAAADGKHVVAFDEDGRLLVLGPTGETEAETSVNRLTGRVTDVAAAPDASRVAVATDRGQLSLINVATGAQVDVATSWETSADVSWLGPTAGGLLLVSSNKSAATFDTTSGTVTARFPEEVFWAEVLDEQRVVTSGYDAHLRVWDARSGQQLAQSPVLSTAPSYMEPYAGSVVSVSRDTDGDGEVVIWNWQAGTEPLRENFYTSNDISDLEVDEANGVVRIASDKEVWSYNLEDGSLAGLLPQQSDWVNDVASSPVGPWAATAGADGRALVWFTGGNWRPVRPTYELLGGRGSVDKVEFLHNGWLLTKSADGSLQRWDLTMPPRFAQHGNWALDVDLSHDAQWLATASTDGYGYIVRTTDITTSISWFGTGTAMVEVHFDPSDPHRVFTLERWARVPQIWQWDETPTSEQPVQFTEPPLRENQILVSIAVSPDGTRLAAGDSEGNVYTWDTRTGQLLADRGLSGRGYPAHSIAFDPVGHLLATTVREGIRLIDTGTGMERVLEHPNAAHVDFDAAGSRLVSVADGGTVQVWTRDGTRIQDFVAHTSRLGQASFSQDGALVAVGSADGRVEVWDVVTGTTLALVRHHGDSVNDVLFAPGHPYQLFTASDDMTVAAWDCSACDDPEAAIDAAETWLRTR